ncbi:MAG: leucine-rich repeat domain-containing protein [Clostridia bacterium]|nr:leucine-rich repeat domain-containing protein [Clostridia bacterium]
MNKNPTDSNAKKSNRLPVIIGAVVLLIIIIIVLAVCLNKCGGETNDPSGARSDGSITDDSGSAASAETPGAESGTETGTESETVSGTSSDDSPAHVHTFGDWTVLKEPDCLTPGARERVCSACGEKQTEELSPLGHEGHNNECIRCGKKALTADHIGFAPYPYGDGMWITSVHGLDDSDLLIPDVLDGQSVTCIAAQVFEENETIETVSLPDSVTQLGTFTFYLCPNLRMIRFGKNIGNQYTSITGYCPNIDYLVVPPENTLLHSDHNCVIETESKRLLYGCRNSIIPDDGSVLILEYTSFQDCTGLTSIVVPSPVTTIENCAFNSCESLVSIEISDSVTSIGEETFLFCKSLKNVRLPAHLKELNTELFEFCESLEEITIPDEVEEIYSGCFYGCTALKTVRLPESLKTIGNYAFQKCSSLESITLPSGLTHLGEAFKECSSLKSIVIPDGVEELFTGAFIDCTSLTDVKLPKDLIRVPRLLFSGCTSLTSVAITNGNEIEEYAFSGCTALKSVTIPASVKYIKQDIFENCTSLKSINYRGSAEDWTKIRISSSNDVLERLSIVYDYKE